MNIIDNIIYAIRAIRSNILRTVLTILIIAIGIMALVGILTAIDGLKSSISDSFSNMGANTFNIRNKGEGIRHGRHGKKAKVHRAISYKEAVLLKKRISFPSTVSVSTTVSYMSAIKFRSEKTNPNVHVIGTDKEYLTTSGFKLDKGRNFSEQELQFGSNVIIIGNDIKQKLFKKNDTIINSTITVGNRPYKIIGLLKEKGANKMFSSDNIVLISLRNARAKFNTSKRNYVIAVSVSDVIYLDAAIGEITGLFRNIRKQKLRDEDNFEIVKSDSLANSLIDNLKYVTIAATIIGFITLLGAAIGLMNILLVAVTERTREIGISKAIGATSNVIKKQFLIEALVICQLGGLLGIILGLLVGNGVTLLIGGSFIIPWLWIIGGILLCFVVGIVSGIYPALKASKLNPIDALRYE